MVDTSDVKVEFILSHKVILSNVILIRKPFSQPSQKPFLLLTWEGSVQQLLIRGKPPQWPFPHSAGPSSAPSRTAHSYLTDISREYYGNHASYRIGNDNQVWIILKTLQLDEKWIWMYSSYRLVDCRNQLICILHFGLSTNKYNLQSTICFLPACPSCPWSPPRTHASATPMTSTPFGNHIIISTQKQCRLIVCSRHILSAYDGAPFPFLIWNSRIQRRQFLDLPPQ